MNDAVDTVSGVLEAPSLAQPPDSVLTPRGNTATDLALALKMVRDFDGMRRWTASIAMFGGWMVAAIETVPLIICLSIVANRPVPQDRNWISLIRPDGTIVNPAKPADEQNSTEKENVITQFMYDYVDYRFSYDWDHVQRNFDRTKFTTAGDAQAEYIRLMNDDPSRPTETLGKDGEKRVNDMTASRVGSDAFEVSYTLRTKGKQRAWSEEHRRVRITYAVLKGMPAEVAARIDPLKLVAIRVDDHPATYDPSAPGGSR